MFRGRNTCLIVSIALLCLQTTPLFSQSSEIPYGEWVKKLSDKHVASAGDVVEIMKVLHGIDSAHVIVILDELEDRGSGKYFVTRFNLLKAIRLWNTKYCHAKDSIWALLKKSLYAAYETGNDSLVSSISWIYGDYSRGCGDIESAAMYCLFAAEIDEKLGVNIPAGRFTLLGDVLYITQDYKKAIHYTKRAIEKDTGGSLNTRSQNMSRWNTAGLCWKKMRIFDSAFLYFDTALALADELNNDIWISIISGNKGQIYFEEKKYDIAKPLLEFDYRASKAYGELASAANSLQWVARINLIEGKKDSALLQVKEALHMLELMPNNNYLQNVYYTAAEVYRNLGNNDSVFKYFQLYNLIHDSIQIAIAGSKLEISRIKLDNLQNAMAIKSLNKEKEAEKLKRNFIIAAILMLAVIVILVLRQRSLHRQQLALQEKAAAEREVAAAREQLDLFKQNIIEKTNLVDKLQQQVQYKETTAEQTQIAEELARHTILTENDWDKFKILFEKIYPGFFMRIKDKFSDITVAEQRMAALTRLHLTTKQMASMLGISVDSVHKTRQRLRSRLHMGSEINLEEAISTI